MPEPLIDPSRGERPRYAGHAVQQMQVRHVTYSDVEAVLMKPDSNEPGNKPRRRVIEGRNRGRRFRVVVVEGSDPLLVVTVIDLGRV